MNNFFRCTLIALLVLAVTLTACKRKSKDEVVVADSDPDLTTERDFSNADNDDNSLMRDVELAIDDTSAANLRQEAVYAEIKREKTSFTISDVTYTSKITITYSGISPKDGQAMSGTATVYFTGTRAAENFKSYTNYIDTKIGGRSISGIRKTVQQASGDTTKWQFLVLGSITLTTIEGKTISYNANRIRIRSGVNPKSRLNITDDSFTITGSWAGTNANGESVSATISSPLQLGYACRYFREITAGKIDFTNNLKGITRSVDYGSGGCDGKGTFITAKGRVFEFYFKR